MRNTCSPAAGLAAGTGCTKKNELRLGSEDCRIGVLRARPRGCRAARSRSIRPGTILRPLLGADLLLHANEVVSTSRLIDDLWSGAPPPGATATLHSHVRNLRTVLEPSRNRGGPSEVLLTQRPGYLLRVAPGDLDAWRSEQLIQEGRRALGRR